MIENFLTKKMGFKDPANRYFLSFVVEIRPIPSEAKSPSIGIDLGIKTFAVISNGEKAESPSYKKLDQKVRKLQRKLARQAKDSKRRNVTRIKIAKLHNRITDTRKDFLYNRSAQTVLLSGKKSICLFAQCFV